MIRAIVWPTIMAIIASLIQSTILSRFQLFKAVPDIALCILVYSSYINGTMVGQIVGFSSGILIDIVSISPLGFNALLRTIIGAMTGFLKGSFFLDYAILPMILCAIATILKAVIVWIIGILFPIMVSRYNLFLSIFWFELLYNSLIAPLVFGFLNMFSSLLRVNKVD